MISGIMGIASLCKVRNALMLSCEERKKVIIFHNKGKITTFRIYFAFSSNTFPASDEFQYWYSVRFHILHGSHSVFGYLNDRVSERCPIDSDK
ncbi:UNVERIFIED_CONTAM: hypothetical protein NCL1_38696 [Trichonephila clavipes]